MPQKKRKKAPRAAQKKICTCCGKELSLINFYTASNHLTSSDGERVNVCKNCVKKESLNEDGSLNMEKFKQMLMLMDKPLVPQALDSAIAETDKAKELGKGRTDIIGVYMKNIITLPQYSKLSFMESMALLESGQTVSANVTTAERRVRPNPKEDVYIRQVDDFVVTDEILDRFGEGYSKSDYRKMQRKYDKLKQNYQISTNLHEEALATYVRFKVKEEQATANGDVGGAEKWNKAAQEAADKAKLTPKQLSQADLQGGITAISEISKAVEEAADIVEILPRFKYSPNDAPDFIIWCYVNFCRKLKGLPEVDYKDIYSFYDKKKEEYIAQYGDPYNIFADDTTEKNRGSVEKFIKLPKDYNVGGDDNGE